MRYPGSKRLLAKRILDVIQERRDGRTTYIEPFLGGANSFAVIAPHFTRAVGIEANLDLALMWQAVKAGWTPPDDFTEADYTRIRGEGPSPLRGFVGVGGSFGGKWFGGIARGKSNAGEPRNYYGESIRAIVAKKAVIENALIAFGDYSEAPITPNCVVYCDPPYAGTLDYSGAVYEFDSATFWRTAERWHRRGALVLVSEYVAPEGWVSVLDIEHRQSVALTADRGLTVERLFAHV